MARKPDPFDDDDFWSESPSQQNTPSSGTEHSDRDDFWGTPQPSKKQKNASGGKLLSFLLIIAAIALCGYLLFAFFPFEKLAGTIDRLQNTPTAPPAATPQPTNPQPVAPVSPLAKYRYHYQKLSQQEKNVYDIIVAGLENCTTEIGPFYLNQETDLKPLVEKIQWDCPELFWFEGGYTYSYLPTSGVMKMTITPNYSWSQQQVQQNKAFVKSAAAPLLSQLSGLSDYEKVLGVYEYLIDNTVYDLSYRGKTLYELFYDHGAVCEGYARSTQYLLLQLDIPTLYIPGDADGLHAWNMVQIDGQWYQLDTTWGDPVTQDGVQTKNFNYFCITSEEMQRDHTADWSLYPVCTATDANYFVRENRYLSSYDQQCLQAWFQEDAASKTLYFKCADAALYRQLKQACDNGNIRDIAKDAGVNLGRYTYIYKDELYTLKISW